jgi:hypothetical protein
VLAVLLAVAVLLGSHAVPAAAQEEAPPPVSLEVFVGYNDSYRVSEWFPITVIASNDGPDIQGTIEWGYPGRDDGNIFQQAIDLPRGARKRLTFYALSNNFARVGDIRLLVDDAAIIEEQIRIEPVEVERFMVGVLSSDETLLNSLSAMDIANASTSVVHLDSELLPENPMALTGIDVIFVHNIATASLSDQQRAALKLWTRLGGQLVVSGGSSAEQSIPGLADVLPVTVQGLQSDASLLPLARMAGSNEIESGNTTTISQVALQPGASAIDNAALLTTRKLGEGRVIFAAFDLSALRAWSGEPLLWERVLTTTPIFTPAAASRWQSDNLLVDVLQLPALSLPSFGVLLLFIIGYIIIIGPLNFIILRRLRRVDLAWLTIPALVALFVLTTYSASFLIRGINPQLLQVAVVQGFEGVEQAQATSFLGVFSPRRSTYTLTMPPETMVSSARFDNLDFDETPLRWSDSETRLLNTLVDVSSIRTFIVERTIPTQVQVSSALQQNGSQIVGTVENQSNLPLRDALLISGSGMQQLGTIAPGSTQQVSLDRFQNNLHFLRMDTDTDDDSEALFNRQKMLNILLGSQRFALGNFDNTRNLDTPLDPEAVYLLGWLEQAPFEAGLSSITSAQESLTLYIIQLQ